MKHIKKYNESKVKHVVSDCTLGNIHTISDTNATFIIDGVEYGFTIRETGDISGGDYETEFLPDHDLPFELTEDLKDDLFKIYNDSAN